MIVIFLAILFFILSIWGKDKIKIRNQKEKCKIALILVIFYLIIYVLLGLNVGYQRSPYSLKIDEILKNLITVFGVLLFYEIVRTKILKISDSWITFIGVSIFFFAIKLEYQNFGNNIAVTDLVEYILADFLNILVESVLLTYLSKKGGYLLNFSYTIPIGLSLILLPIFPNLNWFIDISLRYILYIFLLLFVRYEDLLKAKKRAKREIQTNSPIKLIPSVLLIFLIASFVAGLFPIKPVAVISNSMIPSFKRGDICIIQKISDYKQIKNIQEGDIIEYQLNDIFVLHRVIKVIQADTGFYYYTKGDNNVSQDLLPVTEEQVEGKVLYVIPYLGYPSVWFSEWLTRKSR